MVKDSKIACRQNYVYNKIMRHMIYKKQGSGYEF